MTRHLVLNYHWLPEGELERWKTRFPQCDFADARDPEVAARLLPEATVCYGLPDLALLLNAQKLRWLQLASAGVPLALCPRAKTQGLLVTNLAGLYGPTIAEHALTMLLFLNRNLHVVVRNQLQASWDRSVAGGLRDLFGKTLAIVGLGNIGRNIARLARGFGMRIIGCRRTGQPTPGIDRVYLPSEVLAMLREADHLAVAAPWTQVTQGMLGQEQFDALKPGAIYINVSRGTIAQEEALLHALQSGHLAAAGLDVFAVEPLAPEHPFWSMPNVLVSPHYSGETVNMSSLPAERFCRNLHSWLTSLSSAAGERGRGERGLEGVVNLDHGY